MSGGVQGLFKGRQCGGKLKSGLRKFGLFVAFRMISGLSLPAHLRKGRVSEEG